MAWSNMSGLGTGGGSGMTPEELAEIMAKIDKNTEDISKLKSSELYTNENPTAFTVGGSDKGTVYIDKTPSEMFDAILQKELNPTLTAPSLTFTENAASLVEIGSTTTIDFTASFSRGNITPKNGTSGFRSGTATRYKYTGPLLPASVDSTSSSNTQRITFVASSIGTTTWSCSVDYLAGEQPKTNYLNDFDKPLPAGTTPVKSVSVTAVYPMYATVSEITETDKLSLTNSKQIEVTMAGENDSGDKQTFEYVSTLGVLTGIELYNTLSGKWEWLGGNKEASAKQFVETSVVRNGTQYRKYTNTSNKVGTRQLRFHL